MNASGNTKETGMNQRTRWNDVNNEGGDGFNPHDMVDTPMPRTASDARHELESISGPRAWELGIYNADRIAELEAEIAAFEAAAEAEFAAEWTPEGTTARRTQYNAWATSHRNATQVDADRYARSLGCTVDALRRAIRVNGL